MIISSIVLGTTWMKFHIVFYTVHEVLKPLGNTIIAASGSKGAEKFKPTQDTFRSFIKSTG